MKTSVFYVSAFIEKPLLTMEVSEMKGIYKIVNRNNQKFYIGSSSKISRRWKEHISRLRMNKHHSSSLQKAWNKYGEENFEFVILEEMSDDSTYQQLYEREQFYLNQLNPFGDIGYNLVREAGGGKKGYSHTEETKSKIRISLSGRKFTKAHLERLKQAWKTRKPITEDTRKKLSEAHKGRTTWNKGVETPAAVRQKISVSLRGRISPMKGRTHNQRTKDTMSKVRSGEGNSKAMLNWEQVRNIRILYKQGVSQRTLAKQFGVSRGCIQGITTNKTWSEIE